MSEYIPRCDTIRNVQLTQRSIRYYLSERFRLRFEDTGFDEMMDESEEQGNGTGSDPDMSSLPSKNVFDEDAILDEGYSGTTPPQDPSKPFPSDYEGGGGTVVRTLDGEIAGDEFAQDAINYQILLGKIDRLLDNLKLDA